MLGKILLVLTLAQAQNTQPNGVIHGQILIPSAHAAERIQVTVQRSDGPIVARVFSDTQGNYDARGLPPGSYEVIVNVEGYEEVRQQVAIGTGFFGTAVVNIPLNEKEKMIVIKPDAGAADDDVDINELLASVVKLAPDFYAAHNTLVTLYQKAGKHQESETEYRRARELNPKSPEPLVNLGSLLIDEAAARAKDGKEVIGKLLDDALDTLEEAIKIKRSAKAYYFLGTAYYRSDFYPEAETNFKQ